MCLAHPLDLFPHAGVGCVSQTSPRMNISHYRDISLSSIHNRFRLTLPY